MEINDVWLKFLRDQYPPSSRIKLRSMKDPYRPVEPGTMGILRCIDDMGTFHVDWDNGRRLGLIPSEDSFSVLPPKLKMVKLYMPLTAHRVEYGEGGDGDSLTGKELCQYEDKILEALDDNCEYEEAERGIMHWYGEDDTVDLKVYSVVFSAEQREGQLWRVAECQIFGELQPHEMDALKEYIEGQASDGWGEGFEQTAINIGDADLYVHLWNTDKKWKLMTEEEFMSRNQNEIRVLYVQPGEYPEERTIKADLSTYQSLVDGTIEVVYPWSDYACIVCNDEGKIRGMPLNRELEEYDIMAGPFFVCGLKDDDFCSLTDAQLKKYEELYHDPKVFEWTPFGIASRPCTPEQYKAIMFLHDNQKRGER